MSKDLIFGMWLGGVAVFCIATLAYSLNRYLETNRLNRSLRKRPSLQYRYGQLMAANENFQRECEKEFKK